MLKVKIETETNVNERNAQWHDLMTKAGVNDAYQQLDEIHAENNDYVITDVLSDWARFDRNTALDDMVDTVRLIKIMMDDEVTVFKTIYREGIHEPIDIANRILHNEMKYLKEVEEDEEIWEVVYFDKEQTKIAILY